MQRFHQLHMEAMGLMLESVALTQLNQTDLEFFNAENAFDVQGRTYVLQKIADNENPFPSIDNIIIISNKPNGIFNNKNTNEIIARIKR